MFFSFNNFFKKRNIWNSFLKFSKFYQISSNELCMKFSHTDFSLSFLKSFQNIGNVTPKSHDVFPKILTIFLQNVYENFLILQDILSKFLEISLITISFLKIISRISIKFISNIYPQ